MAGVFEQWSFDPRRRNLGRPRLDERFRIVNGKLVDQRVRITELETLDKFHVRTASMERALICEVGRFDNERVAFPMTSRVSIPQANTLWEMRASVQRNHADFMSHLRQHQNIVRSLHDLNVAV